ncbi:MAG: prepilin-type N-terminal cleavage/methylation domain-containing protein [Deltaproteobacteria bacterium]|nr:prepilin-type N-terminal cleavage/methylation domain-containing protein [Deltaproteobacteria bacterium]
MKTHEKKLSGNNDRGFTLIEIMFALVILSVGVLSLMSMQISTIRTNTAARRITESTNQTSDRFEKLLAIDYEDATVDPLTITTIMDGTYTLQWDVSDINQPIENVKTINVTTSWTEAGRQRSVSYVYYKADLF